MLSKSKKNFVIIFVYANIAAIVGFCCVFISTYFATNGYEQNYEAEIFPIIKKAEENLTILPTIILLFVTGNLLGFLKPKIWWLLGSITLAFFPITIIMEMIIQPTSHNLWPFEFLFYWILNLPALFGSFTGSYIRKQISCFANKY